jgi:branched-chain amino acid transport system permease protein
MNKKRYLKYSGYGALIIFLFIIPIVIKAPYQIHIIIMAGVSVIAASSLRLIASSGQLSLAHAGMMAIGAYTSTLLVMRLGISSWVALVLGGVAAAFVALLVAYPFLRIKGLYFIIITAFLGEIIRLIIEQWRSLTGGVSGIINIPRPDSIVIPGLINIEFASKADFYYFILVLVLVILAIIYAMEHSRIGLTLSSIRQADNLAESIGINTIKFKVIVFCVGSLFAGLAGAFYSQYVGVVAPSVFGFFYAIYIVVYMEVGGSQKFLGPIIGAILLTLIPEYFRGLREYQPFLFAAILILVIFFLPGGLVNLPQRLKPLIKKR